MKYSYPGSIRASPWSGLEYPPPGKGCQAYGLTYGETVLGIFKERAFAFAAFFLPSKRLNPPGSGLNGVNPRDRASFSHAACTVFTPCGIIREPLLSARTSCRSRCRCSPCPRSPRVARPNHAFRTIPARSTPVWFLVYCVVRFLAYCVGGVVSGYLYGCPDPGRLARLPPLFHE